MGESIDKVQTQPKTPRLSELVGLYLHVPFCRALCHYCDFAKTANFDSDLKKVYLDRLHHHARLWWQRFVDLRGASTKSGSSGTRESGLKVAASHTLSSVFFGGGTPSLYCEDYHPFMSWLERICQPGCEVTLEANPDDVTEKRLRVWRDLGFNRISIGVQTFHDGALGFLHRGHSGAEGYRAVRRGLQEFDNVNLDLIYGWKGQTMEEWRSDLERAVATGVPHLSLYTLTYEPRTPIGRAYHRGRLKGITDDRIAGFYELACKVLEDAGFEHEEVSNWAKPGYSCRHNWLYWSEAGSYLGVGAGAHGYLRESNGIGIRYGYPPSERAFVRKVMPPEGPGISEAFMQRLGVNVEDRSPDDWLLEIVASGLRSRKGVDLGRITRVTGRILRPNAILAEGMDLGLVCATQERLGLHPGEWFRESAWSLAVVESLV